MSNLMKITGFLGPGATELQRCTEDVQVED
jgi:hypothetical protein